MYLKSFFCFQIFFNLLEIILVLGILFNVFVIHFVFAVFLVLEILSNFYKKVF